MSRNYLIVLGLIVLGSAGFLLVNKNLKSTDGGNVACTMEVKMCPDGSYVGRSGPKCEFTACEEISYINSTADNITVDLPFPGAVTGKEFSVIGKARGTWYFEASFPVEVLDKNGNVLVITPAQAQSEWMTTEFVPFKVVMKVPDSYIGPATLVLNKDNPSGLPEHDASISFPITIEY